MNILFYTPFNNRSRDTETLMLAFKAQGHNVISLSQAEGKHIHPFLQTQGIDTFTFSISRGTELIYFVRHFFYFIYFCYKHKVNVVYAHLESACFVAALSQFFVRSKVFICRHHVDEAALRGFDKSFYYHLTYKLAKNIIVVSFRALDYMVEVEGIAKNKIVKINLAYDFSLYNRPNQVEIDKIKSAQPADILLVTVGRLTKYKRVHVSIELLKQLLNNGIKARLLVLGAGEELNMLMEKAKELNVESQLVFLGHVHNVIDYIAASDYVIHPSVSESSCVVVKEAGLVNKPVIVCKGVGDFDAYLEHGVNGFLTERDNFVNDAADIISKYYLDKHTLEKVGKNLNQSVMSLFSVETIIEQYTSLNNK